MKFSVIMPTYNQCSFIRRAVKSVICQTCSDWELIIINDGSRDDTEFFIRDYIGDRSVKYVCNRYNTGLGHALNQGLDLAEGQFIAYLPSDDFYFPEHLEQLANILENDGVFLAYSGLKYDNRDSLHNSPTIQSSYTRKGFSMQLVQVAHRQTDERWMERDEWISDDLFTMFWKKLLSFGFFRASGSITAFWTSHPWQRHIIINEKYGGGINKVRSFYNIQEPIRIMVSKEKNIDEEHLYRAFRHECNHTDKPLKILLVGELAYNPQRIYALEEVGHILYGLWVPYPNLSFSTVGPLPFGHVEDIPLDNWKETVKSLCPDIIYGMLNWGAIDWAYEVMKEFPEIPFAWHYKEGPHLSVGAGNWDRLIYLYKNADLKIYLNETVKRFYEQFIPPGGLSVCLDGDLPKKEYFGDTFEDKISDQDHEVHTVCAGRLIGLGERSLQILSENKIHLHLYLENFHSSREKLFAHYSSKFPCYFHLHDHCSPENWTREFSKYDAGWLHCIRSQNNGNLMAATWDDLNIPARISSYAAAGIPVISPDNNGHISAIQSQLNHYDIGLEFNSMNSLVCMLKNRNLVAAKASNMKKARMCFAFDTYVPMLIKMFYRAIENKKG